MKKHNCINFVAAPALALLIAAAGYSQFTAVDTDLDGVPDDRDICPWTPRGITPNPQGCSTLDIAQHPESLTGPLVGELDDIVARVQPRSELSAALREITAARDLLEAAADEMFTGGVCHARDLYAEAQRHLPTARQALADARTALIRSLAGQTRASGDAGDLNVNDLVLILYDVIGRALEASQRNGTAAAQTFGQPCSTVASRQAARGRITKIEDSKRRIQVDGVTVALAGNFRSSVPIAEGYIVDASGYRFTEGTGMAETLTVTDQGTIAAILEPPKCLFLRFAPVQLIAGPFTLLDSDAYKEPNGYSLEQGMGVAVAAQGCDSPRSASYTKQSLEVKLDYWDKNGQVHSDYVIAADMDGSDAPAWFPVMKPNYAATLKLTWYWRDCPLGVCGAKKVLAKQTLNITMYTRHYFCSAEYNTKVLTLDDQDQVNFQPLHVKSLTGAKFIGLSFADGPEVKFRAETYQVAGNTSTYPNVVTLEASCSTADGSCASVPFAVYNHDFYSPKKPYSSLFTGVESRAGVMWPRIVGTRNGKSFSYSCAVPGVTRDAVNKDDPNMWTFYRYPFYPGSNIWSMGQGNNGGFTHQGSQMYAFDFVALAGTEIRAARGGEVVDLREDQVGNKYAISQIISDPATVEMYCDVNKCQANWLLIRHEDGVETLYAHMPLNGVLAQKGAKVYRADAIAWVGNTGYSTGPHLHFQQQNTSGWSLPSCFESGLPNLVTNPCFVPKKGDLLLSNNQ